MWRPAQLMVEASLRRKFISVNAVVARDRSEKKHGIVSECFCPRGPINLIHKKVNGGKRQQFEASNEESGLAHQLHSLISWRFVTVHQEFTSQRLVKCTRR